MTAAGLAFIAGGLATLISFRAVLFGGGARRSDRAGSSARRRRSETVRSAPEPRAMVQVETAESPAVPRRRLVAALSEREPDALSGQEGGQEGERESARQPVAETASAASGLASIGLADDEDDAGDDEDVERDDEPDSSWPPRRLRREPEPDSRAWARRDAEIPSGYAGRFGDLEDKPASDWDRHSGADDRPPAGDYWTPVPDDLYAASAMEPLPPVPDYEPATGFDLPPIPATGPMPEWPPRKRRVQLPRAWAERDDPEKRPSPRPYVSRHSVEGH
ncbi:hypothetical protein SAMN04489716_7639 [Actinoplanes derwentensis]|uniref:Uncharacterized protein n=2 Tax=Actinoplanes derwentensis TaxID=113562 RepID=A0A1H2D2L6_9ACTN|nr:hypothetical protein Ade03nite_89190 [Actinoplanes derwentensis]SDT76496.1 hypothetical protein SAMN04489716_7639 [Actinoplanes derwentensis]